MLQNQKLTLLKKYFKKQPSVVMAFLFGSFAKGREIKESDFDIAVYLKDKKEENKIWSKVTDIVDKEVDLICLNESPASLTSNIFKTGIPLAVKDKKLYWDLYLKESSETEDFLEFAEDFMRIYEKSKSLIPEEKIRLLERIHFLDTELKEMDEFKKITFEEYQNNKSKRRNIERWTENIANATIDIAKIVLASEKKRMPKSYESALFHFGALIGLNEEQAEKFSKFANLRNLLAHEYLDILYGKIQKFIKGYPELYKKMFIFLKKYLKENE